MMLSPLLDRVRRKLQPPDPWKLVRANTLEVRSLEHLKKVLDWERPPVVEDPHLFQVDYLTDLNDRRLRDAEVIGAACANGERSILLEIGTSLGRTTAVMSRNAPDATVYTVNIPPEQIEEGGTLTTFAPGRHEIGSYYRDQGLTNIRQILANTADWEPEFGPIDVALIDGSHDAQFVYDDTRKILERSRPGSIILWHDFAPELIPVYHWIAEVCRGVNRLIADRLIEGRILHLRDSWVGLYVVPGAEGSEGGAGNE